MNGSEYDPVAGYGTGKPIGILATPGVTPVKPETGWELPGELDEMVRAQLRELVIDYDRKSQNARALAWWRTQRHMTLDEAMTKIRARYGTALEALGRL